MNLRRPLDQLAGCGWLPRFVDKARQHLADTLPSDYRRAFGHALATDGAFLAHFQLTLADALAAIAQAPSDEGVARWFLTQPGVNPATIAAWNIRAPRFGEPGQPGERAFRFAMKTIYASCIDPRVNSAFTAIAWDEGYLDDLAPPAHRSSSSLASFPRTDGHPDGHTQPN